MKIYGLIDPISMEIRYIGKTSLELNERLKYHLSDIKTHKINWIKSLLRTNEKPKIFLIANVDDSQWMIYEKFYISFFRSIGCRLTNDPRCPGGENPPSRLGSTAWNKGLKIGPLSDAHKEKVSRALIGKSRLDLLGSKRSNEIKNKISSTMKGKIPSNLKLIHKKQTGIPLSEGHRNKISISKKINPTRYWLGKKRNPEIMEKIASQRRGKPYLKCAKLDKDKVIDIKTMRNAGVCIKDLSHQFNVCENTIRNILNDKILSYK